MTRMVLAGPPQAQRNPEGAVWLTDWLLPASCLGFAAYEFLGQKSSHFLFLLE